jgi:predicted RND superfamily exporter protein
MGTKLKEIGANVNPNSSKQPALPNIDEMMTGLNDGLSKMIQGQEKLKEGTTSLVSGYSNFGTQLKSVSVNLMNLSSSLQNSPVQSPEKSQQAQQLSQISTQLLQLSQKMVMISENSSALATVPENTIIGLKGIQNNLGSQLGDFDNIKNSQSEQLKNMKQLGSGLSDMGDKLITISDNLGTMISYSDSVAPSIPTTQRTLDKMLYDDNGNLRVMFKELISQDKYMTFIVKLKGDVDDTAKSKISASIKDFVNKNPMESIQTVVSGKPVLDNAIRTSMKDSMKKMMGLSIIFMIIVLLITFRVKWSLLPLVAILIAVVGTVGLMGWLNIPVTMVSMAVFPILIGMGIDYSIQFQSRYVEEMEAK